MPAAPAALEISGYAAVKAKGPVRPNGQIRFPEGCEPSPIARREG